MKNKDTIHILAASNDGFAQHFGVTALSVLKNTSFPPRVHFHLIDDDISLTNKQILKELVSEYGAQIEYLKCERSMFEGFYETEHMPVTTYYRLLAPSMLDKDIQKVIYLDSDVVVKSDIKELWEENIDVYALAAVEDNHGTSRFKDLKIPDDAAYFNAGILVINLTFWRMYHIGERVLQYAKQFEGDLIWQDQDALNAVCYKSWKRLHPKWNVQTNMFELRPHEQVFYLSELKEALNQPSIIHYTTQGSKPWFYASIHPFKNDYYLYLNKSHWADYSPKDKNSKILLKRTGKQVQIMMKKLLPLSVYLYLKSKKYEQSAAVHSFITDTQAVKGKR